jgi:adenylosuccinate synthase
MAVIVIVGSQWGDEGKGKIIDALAEEANIVVRFSGGDNAGHTVINPYGEFRLHLVPSGIFYPQTTCIIGSGVVVNPAILLQEISEIQAHGVDVSRLILSDRAHLTMPYHILLDKAEEKSRGQAMIGTTCRGIGPAFADKAARIGIRASDLLDDNSFYRHLKSVLDIKNEILTKIYNIAPVSLEKTYEQYRDYGRQLASMIQETSTILHKGLANNDFILLEGAQGALLDLDFGTYPYVTSSSPLAGAGAVGSGIGPREINHVIGVFKAYNTRVGEGPMPTELKDEFGDLMREKGHEYGATTARPRRCGWFDAVAARFSIQLNSCDATALTHLDVLDSLSTIKICTSYQANREILSYFPSKTSLLKQCQPIYEELPGWQTSTRNIHSFQQLPAKALTYIARLEELSGCPIKFISTGPRREQVIRR